MGLLYLVSVLSLLLLPKSEVREGASTSPVFHDILDGLRYVRDHERLRTLVLMFTLVIILGFPHVTMLPGFVENQLHSPAKLVGVLFGASALGALASSLLVARYADSPRAPALFSMMALGFGVSLLGAAIAPNFATLLLTMVVVGVLSGGFQTLAGAVIVRHTEPQYVGRVLSLMMLSFAGFGLMGLPIGYLADAVGERVTFVAMGVTVSALVLWLRGSTGSESL